MAPCFTSWQNVYYSWDTSQKAVESQGHVHVHVASLSNKNAHGVHLMEQFLFNTTSLKTFVLRWNPPGN